MHKIFLLLCNYFARYAFLILPHVFAWVEDIKQMVVIFNLRFLYKDAMVKTLKMLIIFCKKDARYAIDPLQFEFFRKIVMRTCNVMC